MSQQSPITQQQHPDPEQNPLAQSTQPAQQPAERAQIEPQINPNPETIQKDSSHVLKNSGIARKINQRNVGANKKKNNGKGDVLSKTYSFQGIIKDNKLKGSNTLKYLNKLKKYSSKNQQTKKQDDQQNIDEQQENRYKDLSQKLQTALKKVSSYNKQFDKNLDKCKTEKLLHRFNEHQRKKQKELQQKRKIEQQRKYFGVKDKPDINEKSRQIAQDASYRPIHQRFQKILQQKKKKHEQNEQTKKQKQQQQYQNFLQQLQKHTKLQKQDCRTSQTFFHDMQTWKSKIDKQIQSKINMKKQKEVQGLTFQPILNKKSLKLVGRVKRVPIQEREIGVRGGNQELGGLVVKGKVGRKREQ